MYSLSEYGSMIADRVRMDPYVYALKATVGPESVVLDLGAGTGIHALLACKFGARQVYAVEPSEAIYLAQELARANGFADRITFIRDLSTRVDLPEQVDLIVSDLRGILPLFGTHIPSIIDARKRHLAPGGQLIPKQDTLWIALVEARNAYKELIKPWSSPYGLEMAEARHIILNSWSDADTDGLRKGNLLTEPQVWSTLDYATIESPNTRRTNMTHKATRDGTAHGWLIWFDAEIADGIGFSNGPQERQPANVYGRAFFPLLDPVSVAQGDSVKLSIDAELVGGDYVWRWSTRIYNQDDAEAIKADFEQSSDCVWPPRRQLVSRQALDCRPSLGDDGEMALFVLGKMDGRTPLKEIAQQTYARFSALFKDEEEALLFVDELSQHYRR